MKGKGKAGRPVKFRYDQTTADTVQTLATYGVPYEDIAAKYGMSSDTLVKLYSEELKKGKAEAHEKARGALFEEAVLKRNPTLLMFYCKTQLGMKETSGVELTNPDGSMTPLEMTVSFVAVKEGKGEGSE